MTHDPVLLEEALLFLRPERGGTYVDCTLGLGGHTEALVARGATRVIGIDRDAEALASARTRLATVAGRFELVHADYRALSTVLSERGITAVDGILADLGVSSLQFDSEGRGFSFRRDEPLDMRMDQSQGPTAAELLDQIGEEELANLIFEFGEERYSRRIARAIVEARRRGSITFAWYALHSLGLLFIWAKTLCTSADDLLARPCLRIDSRRAIRSSRIEVPGSSGSACSAARMTSQKSSSRSLQRR